LYSSSSTESSTTFCPLVPCTAVRERAMPWHQEIAAQGPATAPCSRGTPQPLQATQHPPRFAQPLYARSVTAKIFNTVTVGCPQHTWLKRFPCGLEPRRHSGALASEKVGVHCEGMKPWSALLQRAQETQVVRQGRLQHRSGVGPQQRFLRM
jgi:hypothetical protein